MKKNKTEGYGCAFFGDLPQTRRFPFDFPKKKEKKRTKKKQTTNGIPTNTMLSRLELKL